MTRRGKRKATTITLFFAAGHHRGLSGGMNQLTSNLEINKFRYPLQTAKPMQVVSIIWHRLIPSHNEEESKDGRGLQ
jgi:hypothetical protein